MNSHASNASLLWGELTAMTILASPTGHSPSRWWIASFVSVSPPAGEAESILCEADDRDGNVRADNAIFSKLFMHNVVYAS
jgi:hypothetical protein